MAIWSCHLVIICHNIWSILGHRWPQLIANSGSSKMQWDGMPLGVPPSEPLAISWVFPMVFNRLSVLTLPPCNPLITMLPVWRRRWKRCLHHGAGWATARAAPMLSGQSQWCCRQDVLVKLQVGHGPWWVLDSWPLLNIKCTVHNYTHGHIVHYVTLC